MSRLQRWLLWSSSIATGVTGIIYWWMKHMLEPLEPWAAINHPLQPWILKAHILAAPVLVFAVGLVATEHIWRHLRGPVCAGRRSGLLTTAVFVPMVGTGYLIQAVTGDGWLTALAWGHLAAGASWLVGVTLHHRLFRTRAR